MTGRMTREQAEAIQHHLLDASRALGRAASALVDVEDDESGALSAAMVDVSSRLYRDLLQPVYARFPDLAVPMQVVGTVRHLRWEDVALPPSITESDLDGLIFSLLKPGWINLAVILVLASRRCEELSWPLNFAEIAARIQALVDAGRIEHEGDLQRLGAGDVRLPALKDEGQDGGRTNDLGR
ncbi:hypothetical protein [Bradyrhizobium sp. HKCCYLS20291]|uniref:hypothetical protein n=1 Tax=Bradyrhizobium sp. HKCCYLS20291 TaxID=3420766 RepID=UPI003EBAA67E